jgi:hypothetical protein
MTTKPENHDDTIDSREVIERIEELEAEREALSDHVDECQTAYDFHDSDDTKTTPEWRDLCEAIEALADWDKSDETKELARLQALADQCDHVSDWMHGETLIREDYFTKYIEYLIEDCYEMPKEINSGAWPYCHITIDYEAAAEEAKVDYEEVDFDGVTYFIRSV